MNITTLQDIVGESEQLHQQWSLKTDVWWRGQASKGSDEDPWLLHPKVFREDRSDMLSEHELIQRFKLQAPSRYEKCPDDIVDWLFLMQHYSLATRLLDWSRSALVGLYFSVREGHDSDDGIVWALHPGLLNEKSLKDCDYSPRNQVALPYEPPIRFFLEAAEDPDVGEEDRVVAVACVEAEPRMLIQQAAFTIHCSPKPLDDHDRAADFLVKFVIPRDAKPALRTALLNLGIHEAYLFPDLDHLSNFLNDFEFE